MFNQEESQFILTAINEEIKRTGLQNASMALVIVGKLQTALQEQIELDKQEK